MGDEGCQRIEHVEQAQGILLAHRKPRIGAEEAGFERVQQPDQAALMQAQPALQRIGDDAGEGGDRRRWRLARRRRRAGPPDVPATCAATARASAGPSAIMPGVT